MLCYITHMLYNMICDDMLYNKCYVLYNTCYDCITYVMLYNT